MVNISEIPRPGVQIPWALKACSSPMVLVPPLFFISWGEWCEAEVSVRVFLFLYPQLSYYKDFMKHQRILFEVTNEPLQPDQVNKMQKDSQLT